MSMQIEAESLAVGRAAALALAGGRRSAQISDDVIKIGVMSDMSSLYADIGGPGLGRRRAAWRSRTSAPPRRA